MNYRIVFSLLIVLSFVGCDKLKKSSEKPLFTQLDSAQTNINFVNHLPEHDEKFNFLDYLYYYNGGGVATGDINNDGLADVFFVSNKGENKLYLNKGNFQFEDISKKSGTIGFADWKTGVTMADVNGDGLLDIYVCVVGNYKGLEGANELYINNGDLTFTEKAAEYGLDFTGFSTQAAFFDYDKDGDLDCYLLNHAVHTTRSYNKVLARFLKDNEAGDYMYRNDNGKFTDVSKESGIYQALMGYGLGVAVADLNNDGWDDIYVSNDFHEDDYYYINNKNGTYTEGVKDHFKHLSRYSMGCDIADINNDGFQDVMTLDMYPEDETMEKSSAGEDPLDIYLAKLSYGYFNQYSRNCLQLNMSGQKFSDIGVMSGVAATDWSWSTLLADYDNDGIKDIFITNGIVHRPNNLDYQKFAMNDSLIHSKEISKNLSDKAISLMPDGKVHNYVYKGTKSLHFEDKSIEWGFQTPDISNGASYADLDNDGDLDLITNNINQSAGIYRNETRNSEVKSDSKEQAAQPNYLKIKLKGEGKNTFGMGAKVMIRNKGAMQFQQLSTTHGFLSSVEPVLSFGLGNDTILDTLIVVWESQKIEIKTSVKANQTLILNQKDALLDSDKYYGQFFKKSPTEFKEITDDVKVNYTHQENIHYDFNREYLIPFMVSTEGPKVAVGDVNGDGLDDFYVGGAKWKSGKLFIQNSSSEIKFTLSNEKIFDQDSTGEDVDAVFFDADNDKDLDLYVVSGGNEFFGKMPQLFDRLYLNDGKGFFTKGLDNLPPMYDNKSCVKPCDFDKDGDLDLFVGGRVVGFGYGNIPNSYLLINDGKGHFSDNSKIISPEIQKAGMVTDAVWVDLDKDNDQDLVVVGDWMGIKIFENDKGKLKISNLDKPEYNLKGFWQTISAADFDKDGDVDLVVGNLGTNSKFIKDANPVLKMYVKDIDKNGENEHILAYNRGDKWYPVAFKDELGKKIPSIINKKFTDYQSYAGKTIDQIFTAKDLDSAEVLEVNKFESVYLENKGNKQFTVKSLPFEAQISKIFALHTEDIDKDGNLDILLGGNSYGVSTYQGRYDASYGLMLKGDGKGNFKSVLPTESGFLLDGQIRDIKTLHTKNDIIYLVARNGLPLQIFKKLK